MKKTLLSLLVFGGMLSAAPVNVTYLNPGSPAQTYGGDYVGPYNLSINGVTTPAMCLDDFLHVSSNEKWTANVTAANSSNLGNTYLGSGDLGSTTRTFFSQTYSASQVYTAEAYLFSQILKPSADRGHIQEAAWAIMDTNTWNSIVHSNSADNITVRNYVTTAFNNLNFDTKYYSIISQSGAYSNGSAQEFMVASAPEPASLALFGSGILAAGLARFIRRRKSGGVA